MGEKKHTTEISRKSRDNPMNILFVCVCVCVFFFFLVGFLAPYSGQIQQIGTVPVRATLLQQFCRVLVPVHPTKTKLHISSDSLRWFGGVVLMCVHCWVTFGAWNRRGCLECLGIPIA